MSETTARAPRRWSLWLIASLCLNVFLIGVVIMGLIVARNRMTAAAMGGAFRPDIVVQMLPKSGALKMCDVMAKRTPAFRRLGRDFVEARRAMFRVFRTEPFDQAVFKAALARVTAAEAAVARERADTTGDIVARLTPEERKHFTREVTARFFSPAGRQSRRAAREPGALAAICKGLGAPGASELPQ